MRALNPCRECGSERLQWDVVRGGGVRCSPCRNRAWVASQPNPLDPSAVAASKAIKNGRGGRLRNLAREARCIKLHSQGYTLEAIGGVYGITRERVRQILKRAGITRQDGGIAQRSRVAKALRKRELSGRWDARRLAMFGCDQETFLALNDGINSYAKSSNAKKFMNQKRHAVYRGIAWEMTFPEWCSIWQESGHFEDRGRWGNGYCMARFQDFGPYAVWNVYITTLRQNVVDYQAELKIRGVKCDDGYKRLPERAQSMGAAA